LILLKGQGDPIFEATVVNVPRGLTYRNALAGHEGESFNDGGEHGNDVHSISCLVSRHTDKFDDARAGGLPIDEGRSVRADKNLACKETPGRSYSGLWSYGNE
jgi:hypothetical protein